MNRELINECLKCVGSSFELASIVNLSQKAVTYRNEKYYTNDGQVLFVGDAKQEYSRCLQTDDGILRILYVEGKVYCKLTFTVSFDCDVLIAEFMRDITGHFYVGDMPREGEKDITQMLHDLEQLIIATKKRRGHTHSKGIENPCG